MKKQNFLTSIIALALVVFVALACGNSDKEQTSSAPSSSKAPSSRDSGERSSTSGGVDLSTPIRSHASMYQAMKSRDIASYKQTMSQCYLDQAAVYARRQNISTDKFLKNSLNLVPAASIRTPEVRNEQIDGDTATLEEKDFNSGGWNTANYVKDADGWKFNMNCNN